MDGMDNMKNCPQCGEKILSTAKFCGNCGYRFPAEEAAQASVETAHIDEMKIPAPPVIESFATPTPEQPASGSFTTPTPEQPASGSFTTPTPEQPAGGSFTTPTPEQPASGSFTTPTPGQPASGSFATPSYPPYSPVQPPQKKGKGGLIAFLSILGVLVLAALVLVLGMLLGWFKKKEIELSETKVTVIMEEEVTVEVGNYKEIGEPELTATVQEGKEDLIEVEVKDEEIIITGVEEGRNITVTVSAKGCEDTSFKVTVEEPEEEVELPGTAWNVEGLRYYFMENGMMYLIYEEQEDYIKGTYTVANIEQKDVEDYVSVDTTGFDNISDGTYFLVEVDVEQELYYGNEYEADDYYLIVCTDGKDCAIYDSSWDYVAEGASAAMESESNLDSYFEVGSTGGDTPEPSGSVATGGIPGISFGEPNNVKETWHIAKYESANGDILIYKDGGNLWGLNEDSGAAAQLTDLEDGQQVTIFAVYGDYLFYGVGPEEEEGEEVFYSDTDAFYKVDLSNDTVEMLSDDISIKDFVIYNDNIYYTDYSTLFKMDFEGNIETLYEYGVFTFEVSDEYIFVYDGNEWEAIDPEDGTDYGYLAITDGEYEADVVRYEDEMIFFTAYNYDDTNIYLYAMDYDGNVTQIGDADWGETWDTYNVAFDDQYVIYTVNGGEVIVKTDVTSGAYETMSLSDFGYYYATGMMQCGDDIYLYAWDDYGDVHYLELDPDDLSVEELTGVTAQQ